MNPKLGKRRRRRLKPCLFLHNCIDRRFEITDALCTCSSYSIIFLVPPIPQKSLFLDLFEGDTRDGQSERLWVDSWAIMTPIIKQ